MIFFNTKLLANEQMTTHEYCDLRPESSVLSLLETKNIFNEFKTLEEKLDKNKSSVSSCDELSQSIMKLKISNENPILYHKNKELFLNLLYQISISINEKRCPIALKEQLSLLIQMLLQFDNLWYEINLLDQYLFFQTVYALKSQLNSSALNRISKELSEEILAATSCKLHSYVSLNTCKEVFNKSLELKSEELKLSSYQTWKYYQCRKINNINDHSYCLEQSFVSNKQSLQNQAKETSIKLENILLGIRNPIKTFLHETLSKSYKKVLKFEEEEKDGSKYYQKGRYQHFSQILNICYNHLPALELSIQNSESENEMTNLVEKPCIDINKCLMQLNLSTSSNNESIKNDSLSGFLEVFSQGKLDTLKACELSHQLRDIENNFIQEVSDKLVSVKFSFSRENKCELAESLAVDEVQAEDPQEEKPQQ